MTDVEEIVIDEKTFTELTFGPGHAPPLVVLLPCHVNIEMVGGGGGGGGASDVHVKGSGGGGGGFAGAHTFHRLLLMPGHYVLVVGAGGEGGQTPEGQYPASNGQKGGLTSLVLKGDVLAHAEGGDGGLADAGTRDLGLAGHDATDSRTNVLIGHGGPEAKWMETGNAGQAHGGGGGGCGPTRLPTSAEGHRRGGRGGGGFCRVFL